MSDIISGKDAWLAKFEGKNVQYKLAGLSWQELTDEAFLNWASARFLDTNVGYVFRLKPETVKVGDLDVQLPFEPKDGEIVWFLTTKGYSTSVYREGYTKFGWVWRTEEEVQKVVNALDELFKSQI